MHELFWISVDPRTAVSDTPSLTALFFDPGLSAGGGGGGGGESAVPSTYLPTYPTYPTLPYLWATVADPPPPVTILTPTVSLADEVTPPPGAAADGQRAVT